MTFSERLRELIEMKGITPYIISQKTGVSQATLSRILSNSTVKPSMRVVESLALYFHTNVEWLLTGRGEMLKPESISINDGKNTVSESGDPVIIKFLDALARKDAEIKELREQLEKYRSEFERLRLAVIRGKDDPIK